MLPFGNNGGNGSSSGNAGGRTVVVVHGVRGDVTCAQVFNIFCNFGVVIRVKQLVHKPTIRLVQFHHAESADAAVRLLNGVTLLGTPLDVRYSRFTSVLPDQHVSADSNAPNNMTAEGAGMVSFAEHKYD